MFLAGDKPQKKQLKKGAVSSIFAWSKAETSSSQARLSRLEARRMAAEQVNEFIQVIPLFSFHAYSRIPVP